MSTQLPGPARPSLRARVANPHRSSAIPEVRSVSMVVDARGIYASGIGRYLREILTFALRDPRFRRITLLGEPEALEQFREEQGKPEGLVVHHLAGGFYSPRSQLAWLASARRLAADVAFFPHYDAPLLAMPRASVVTVHDLTHFQVPELFGAGQRRAAAVLLRRAVTGAHRVITVSEATSRDLRERFPQFAAKVQVIPNGVDADFGVGDPSERSVCSEVAVLRPYLLCVGNRKPHKNLTVAVEALARLRRDRPELRLVFAGRAYRGWEAVLARADQLGVRDALVDLGEVGDSQLRCLYAECEALLFPSLYEGFGLPALEAMVCGAPVVASNRAALPEVVGDAALLADPTDPDAFALAVTALRDPATRTEYLRRGRRRAAEFAWTDTARRTADLLYQTALACSAS